MRQSTLNRGTVDGFLRLRRQMRDLLSKMSAISAKVPDLAINKFKVALVNEQLVIANHLLGDTKPFRDFETFIDGSLPTNSDVVVVLSQYLSCLEQWRCARVSFDEDADEWFWKTSDRSEIETSEPSEE